MKRFFLFTWALFFLMNLSQAQNEATKLNALRSQLIEDSDATKLQTADKNLVDADKAMKEVVALEKRLDELNNIIENERGRDKRRAKREARQINKDLPGKLFATHKLYAKAFDETYIIYKNYINKLPTNDVDKTRQANLLFEQAKNNFNSAKGIENKLTVADEYDNLVKEWGNAFQLRSEGINLMVEGFWVFLKPAPVVEEVVEVIVPQEEVIDPNSDEGIWFRVQIMAVSKPLNDTDIQKFYYGEQQVAEKFLDGLYKYFAGKFLTYDEARSYQDMIGIQDAFIVGFEDGNAISNITEAIEKSNR